MILLALLLQVDTLAELRDAAAKAKPGTRILIAAGTYDGVMLTQLRGQKDKPIILAAADPKNPPVFRGQLHLSEVEYVELHDLTISGSAANGLNIDDGGSYDTPSHHVVLRNLRITDIGPRGNLDGIKMSGVDDFRIENCTIERWGAGGGSGIDMVGCHRGRIEGNTLRHVEGEGTGASGVQMKGGCSDIVVRRNRFEHAGSRSINIGGSTGLPYFRPPLKNPPHVEAKAITVEGNTFVGSDAPIAFVGVDGAVVRYNTIYAPRRWAIRILQETTEPGFVPCRKGEFSRNVVVFRSSWSEGGVNVGANTDAKSFVFSRNWWYCLDDPARSRPKLPTDEKDGVTGKDPQFRDAAGGDLRLRENSPAREFGADALK